MKSKKWLEKHRGRVWRAHKTGTCWCGAAVPQKTKRGNSKLRTKAKYRALVVELGYTPISKVGAREGLRVRSSPSAPWVVGENGYHS